MGQRVGIGPQTGSCGTCEQCKTGRNQLCSKKVKSYNTPTGDPNQPYTYGGFADRIRSSADWAFPIPDSLDSVCSVSSISGNTEPVARPGKRGAHNVCRPDDMGTIR